MWDSAAVPRDSQEPASPPIQESLVWQDKQALPLPVLWEMGAEAKEHSLLQHVP